MSLPPSSPSDPPPENPLRENPPPEGSGSGAPGRPRTGRSLERSVFVWGEGRCTVDAPPDLARTLHRLFPTLAGPGAAHRDSPHAGDVADLTLESSPGGWRVGWDGGEELVDEGEALAAAELTVTRRLLEADGHRVHLHGAAAVGRSGRAALAVGPSGSGKSTLAYAWYRQDRPLLGDDVVVLDGQGHLHPFPRPLTVDAERLREAGERPEAAPGWTAGDLDAWVDPRRRSGWADHGVPVGVVAEIGYRKDGEVTWDLLEGAERLRVLLGAVHRTGRDRPEALDTLIGLVESVPVYRVRHADAGTLARGLLERADAGTR